MHLPFLLALAITSRLRVTSETFKAPGLAIRISLTPALTAVAAAPSRILPMAIEAGQSVPFAVEHERARPARDDGQLMLTVKVIALTQWAFVAP